MSFEDFWSNYPRKVAKGAARKAYEKALTLASEEEIMQGLEAFNKAEPWHGEKVFCPHPSTWLNREQWADEYEDDKPVWRDMTLEERREYGRRLVGKNVVNIRD